MKGHSLSRTAPVRLCVLRCSARMARRVRSRAGKTLRYRGDSQRENTMYAITGITGNVGGSVANNLVAAGWPVRAVMRNVGKGDVWSERGCEVVQADIADATSLASAFKGVEGVIVLIPPNFDPAPGFPEARATAASLKAALERASCPRYMYQSQ